MQPDRDMTDEQIEHLVAKTAEETANRVVATMFIELGFDISKPTEMQADMMHLRAWRNSMETVKRQGMITAIGVMVLGLLGMVWTAVANTPHGQ